MSEVSSIIEYSEDLSEAEAPKALPASDYPVTITGAENGISQSSGNPRAKVTLLVAPEDFPADYEDGESFPDGKQVDFYVSTADTAAARFRMRQFLEAIGAPLSSKVNVEDWIGRQAIATLEPDEYEGIERERCRKVSAK
jgi:hypothetical protein